MKFNETEKVEHTRNVVSETNGYVLLFGIRWRLTNVGLSIDCNDWLNTTDNFCDIPTKKIITRNDATHINTIISNKRKRPLCILRLRVCLSDNPYTAKEKQYRKHILFEIILETMIICIGKRKKKKKLPIIVTPWTYATITYTSKFAEAVVLLPTTVYVLETDWEYLTLKFSTDWWWDDQVVDRFFVCVT